MLRYVISRLIAAIPLLLIVSAFVFFFGQFAAGDLAMNLTLQTNGGIFDPEVYQTLREKLHQDVSPPVRFARFVAGAVQGDFGVSYVLPGTPDIGRMIVSSLPISLQLGLVAMLLTVLVGIPLGVVAALTRNSILDHLVVGGTTIFSAMPPFVLAPILMVVLVVHLGVVPSVGLGWHGIFSTETLFPAAVLAAGPLLGVVRFTRASVTSTLAHEYVRTARAKGLPERQVLTGHVLRNSLTPVVTTVGIATAHVISGSIFIETIFNIRGFGYMAVSAFRAGDVQTVAATTLVSAAIIIVMNLLVDLTYGLLDPRVRLGADR
ncbi:MAG: ABC transporter permease [Thermomicrobiales bacterium]